MANNKQQIFVDEHHNNHQKGTFSKHSNRCADKTKNSNNTKKNNNMKKNQKKNNKE